jgi:hypothetical protein
MAKKIDPKAKAKRQKIIAIVGAVLLVLVLVVELPGTLKQLNPPRTDTAPSSAPTSTVVTPAAGTLAPPTLAGSGTPVTPAAAVAAGALVSTDSPAAPSVAKLVSFSLFVSKDPFRQQVSAGGTPVDGSGPTGTGTGTGTGTTPTTPAPPTPPTATTPSTPQPPQTPPTSIAINVNGTIETVTVGKTFPAMAAQPFFQLVSVNATSAKIGIAGGSLTNGQNTVTIPVGKTVTLMNTADGTKYTLKLVSVS